MTDVATMPKLWVNSADGHVFEPEDIWTQGLPASMHEMAPRSEKTETHSTSIVEGKIVRRDRASAGFERPPGAHSVELRLKDMDQEGVWGQVLFPSNALHVALIRDRDLSVACAQVYNDWLVSDMLGASPRFVGAAIVSQLETEDAIAEAQRAVGMGCRGIMMSCEPPPGREYNLPEWDPFWAAAEELGVPLCFHIGTGSEYKVNRGPGGTLINYVETAYHPMRAISHLVSCGALERHPGLNVMVAEGGAAWAVYLGDRLDEAYRQHATFTSPKLAVPPSETIRRQVYTSFQHDQSAVATITSMNYDKVMWGDDYPHWEGTFGHSQEVLRGLLEGASPEVVHRVTQGAFAELWEMVPIGSETAV